MVRLFISFLFIFAFISQGIARQVTVSSGDTLYSIAIDNGVNLVKLADFNNISKPYVIYKGQTIKIPSLGNEFSNVNDTNIVDHHIVKSGQTLFYISRKYNVNLKKLASYNNIYQPYQIKVGQKIKIPSENNNSNYLIDDQIDVYNSEETDKRHDDDCDDDKMHTSDNQKIVPILRSTAKIYNGQGTILPNEVNNDDVYAENNYEKIRPSLKSDDSSGRYNSSRYGFMWPLKGRVIADFGPRKGGIYNDGINIKASMGSPVTAANEGIVIYSKNKLKGYGNLILLKHDNGYITSYAHNDELLVDEGDVVDRGQKIATVGNSGSVRTPQLHFTIRKGRLAVNPQSYLPNS